MQTLCQSGTNINRLLVLPLSLRYTYEFNVLKLKVNFYFFFCFQFLFHLDVSIGICDFSMGCQLGAHGHSHGGSSHDSGHAHGGSHENINVRAAFIHVIGDVLQSIGVFCAALVVYFKPEWAIADPICTFIFSIIVLCTTITILKDAVMVSLCSYVFCDFTCF